MNFKIAVLHLAKSLGIFALARQLTRSRPRILCYHGGSLGDEHLFNPKLFCRPGLLAQRLAWLKRHGFVSCTLDSLLQKSATTTGIPLVVTLDDGWYSSYTDLLPLLASQGFSSVLYLATRAFSTGMPILDVCIRYLVWKSPFREVEISGLGLSVDGTYRLVEPADRQRFCNAAETWVMSKTDSIANCHAALEQLATTLGVSPQNLDLASRRFSYLCRDELLVAAAGGCQVELHGHRHQFLRQEPEKNLADIQECRRHIVACGLPSPIHYCYPSGTYDNSAPATLRLAGVSTATTCVPGFAHQVDGDLRFFLPRFLDGGDVEMIEFEAEMSGLLEFARRYFRRIRIS